MHDENSNTTFSRRPSTNIVKARPSASSITFQRKSSGYIPSLNVNNRPLSNVINVQQRSMVNKRKTTEFEYDVPTSNYATVHKQSQPPVKRVKQEQPVTPKKKLLPEDGSVRLVTSTVQGMKHWTSKNLPYPLLFEVFGKLDSQVTHLSSSHTCQFSLIDEKDRLECIFAEIDQSFSNIDRDVQLRIICRYDPSQNIARCITIRVAANDEWHERRASIKQCDIQLNDDGLQAKKSTTVVGKNWKKSMNKTDRS